MAVDCDNRKPTLSALISSEISLVVCVLPAFISL